MSSAATNEGMDADTRAILSELLGFDPETPCASSHCCGACSRGDHADCSGWCQCHLGCRDAAVPDQATVYTAETAIPRDGWALYRCADPAIAGGELVYAIDPAMLATEGADIDRPGKPGTAERLRRFGWLRAIRQPHGQWGVLALGEVRADVAALFDAAPMLLSAAQPVQDALA